MPDDLELRMRRLTARAINKAANEILSQSQQEVPLDDSTLLNTGEVSKEAGPYDLSAEVSYGTAYGAAQHEGKAWHTSGGERYFWEVTKYSQPGRKKKFLEDPLKATAPRLEAIVGRIVEVGMKSS